LDLSDKTNSDKFPVNDSPSISKDRSTRISRRKFVVVGGVAVGVIVGSTLYYLSPALRNLVNSLLNIGGQGTTTTTAIIGPTTIEDLQWTPTRTVNSKVYDGTVGFTVDNLNPSDQITLDFDSIYPPGIPQTAFTSEADRTYAFTGTGKKQTFSQDIANLIGGRQYRALVTVKDKNGRETVNYADTPYVREFENIAKDAGILVGVTYYSWFENICNPSVDYCHWLERESNDVPLLGLYNSDDPLVISKHIDWATGFGVHHFFCSYNTNPTPSIGDRRLKPLLSNSLIKDIKFAIQYETGTILGGQAETLGLHEVDLNNPIIFSKIQSDFEHIARNYFLHSSYLTINGRPVVYIYGTGAIVKDIVAPFAKLRQHLRGLGFDPYFIGDEMDIGWLHQIKSKRLQTFDAVTGYSLPQVGADDKSPEAVRKEYTRWQLAAHSVGIEVIPSVYPGYDDHHLVEIGSRPVSHGYVPRSTEFFKTNLKIAKEFIDNSRILKVSDWNQWGENSYIEPSVEDGFKYLKTLHDTLAGQ